MLTAVAMAMYRFGILWGERALTFIIPVVMGLVAVEVILNLILDIYRPRVPGQEARPPYDSRLLGLFAEPEGVLKTVAATLDYQFGFKVSETWFYHFMERMVLPLVLVQVVSLWLLTSLVIIEPNEVAFVERMGRPYVSTQDAAKGLRGTVFGPGFRLKAPWPFAVTRRIPAGQVLHLEIGKVYEGSNAMRAPIAITKSPDIILWRELHIDPRVGFEANFLVPSKAQAEADARQAQVDALDAEVPGEGKPQAQGAALKAPAVNLARLEAHVYYRVKHKPDGSVDGNAAFAYYYNEEDTTGHLEQLAFRAMCRVAASQDFLKWIAQERADVTQEYLRALREGAEQAGLGVEVVDATINAVHPPAEVAQSYEQVVKALEERESSVQEGEQASNRTRRQAEARTAEMLQSAESYKFRAKVLAEADAELFEAQLVAYHKAPLVYIYRTYLTALEQVLNNQRVYVVPKTDREVQVIDLQEKIRPFILDNLDALQE
jgi:membrane protease subunit HflK